MRGATKCAQRLRQYFSRLRNNLGKVTRPTVTDPVTQLVLGILSRNAPESKARQALDTLRGMVVDYNELRVMPALELAEALGDYPQARAKADDINRALNYVFARQHDVTLDYLLEMPLRDVNAALAEIDGLEDYTRARIRLLGLQQHAIPLDEAMWALAQQEEIVAPRCELGEAQAFLERQISKEDALEFVALLHKAAWTEMAAAVKAGTVEPIQSVPAELKTSHMLAELAPAGAAQDGLDAGFGLDDLGVSAEVKATIEEVAAPSEEAPRRRRRVKESKATTTTKAAKKTSRGTKRSGTTAAAKRTTKKPASKAASQRKSTTRKNTKTKRSSSKSRK